MMFFFEVEAHPIFLGVKQKKKDTQVNKTNKKQNNRVSQTEQFFFNAYESDCFCFKSNQKISPPPPSSISLR